MSKQPPKKSAAKKGKKRYPSREKTRYAGIPKEYWAILRAMGKEQGPYERRSGSFLVTLAVREWLERNGRLPPRPGSPGTIPPAGK